MLIRIFFFTYSIDKNYIMLYEFKESSNFLRETQRALSGVVFFILGKIGISRLFFLLNYSEVVRSFVYES